MNAKQLADEHEWLGDIPYEVIYASEPANDFVKFGRESFLYAIGESDFVQSRPMYINDRKITDVFLYLQHWVCNLLQKDLEYQAIEGKPIKIMKVRPPDNTHFRSFVFPLVIWKIHQDQACMLIKGYIWVEKSTVKI